MELELDIIYKTYCLDFMIFVGAFYFHSISANFVMVPLF